MMVVVNFFKKSDLSKNLPFLICCIFFILSFWCYFFYLKSFGSKYFWPATFLGSYFNLPFDAIKGHFWQSLLYYHIQLPLYLAYVYLFEFVLFPSQTDFLRGFVGYYLLHLIFGLWMIYALHKIMEIYQVNKWLSCFLISVFVSTPAFYIYASQGTHDFLTMCLVAISAYLLLLALKSHKTISYFWFFLILALLMNVRSLFHPILFFVPVVAILLIINSKYKKNILIAAFFPFMLGLAPYIKNYIVFHKFTATTHAGVIYVQSTYEQFTNNEEKLDAVEKKIYSDLALCTLKYDDVVHGRFVTYEGATYDKKYCSDVIWPKYGKQYLEEKSGGFDNIPILWGMSGKEAIDQDNHIYLIGKNDQNTKDAVADLFAYPQHFFAKFDEVWRITFKPALAFMYGNAQDVRKLPDSLVWTSHNMWPGGSYTTKPLGGTLETRASLPLVILFPTLLLLAFGISLNVKSIVTYAWIFLSSLAAILIAFILIKTKSIAAWEDWGIERASIKMMFGYSLIWLITLMARYLKNQKNVGNYTDQMRYLALYMFATILYSTTLTALLTGTEQNRYRIYIDPFLLILIGVLIANILSSKNRNMIKKKCGKFLNQII